MLLIKNHLKYLKDNPSLKCIIDFYFFKKIFFFTIYNDQKPKIRRKIIKDIRNLFRLKKEQNKTAIKDIRNFFRLKQEIKVIKNIVLRNIKNLFQYEKEEVNYYKPVIVNNFWNNNCIEYNSNSDENNR